MTTLYAAVLRFTQTKDKIAGQQDAHNSWLRAQMASGHLLLAGPQLSRRGGIMLIQAEDEADAAAILCTDPFQTHDLAEVEILPFEAALCAPELELRLGG